MAIKWADGKCAARNKAYEKACESGEFDGESDAWDEYTDLREALIWGLVLVKFPPKCNWTITENNWQEIFLRLNMVETSLGCYRRLLDGGKMLDVFFSPEEIQSMIGFEVNAGNQGRAACNNQITTRLLDNARAKLNRFLKKQEETNETDSKG